MSKLSTLKELMVEELRDTYSSETQIAQALPKMAAKSTSPQLKAAFEKHLVETQNQVQRLEKIFQHLGESPEGGLPPYYDPQCALVSPDIFIWFVHCAAN